MTAVLVRCETSSRTQSTCCPPFPVYSLLSIAEAISSAVLPAVHVQVHPRFVNLTSRQLFWRFVNFLTFRQLFWHFVNFFLLTPNLTKKVDETSIQKVDETSVPRPGPWLLSGVWRRPYTGVSGRPVFACLQPVRRREFSWVYTGVVLASNVANRVYRFYTFRFSTTATEKIVLLYEQITYASALS